MMRLILIATTTFMLLSCKTLENNGTDKESSAGSPLPAGGKNSWQESECGILVDLRPLNEQERDLLSRDWRLIDDLTTKNPVVIDGRNDFFIYGFKHDDHRYLSTKYFFKSKASGKPYNKEDNEKGSFNFESVQISNVITEGNEKPYQVLIYNGISSYYDEFECIVTGIIDAESNTSQLTMFSWLARKKDLVHSIKSSAAAILPSELIKTSATRTYEVEENL